MRLRELLREIVSSARARLVPTILTMILAAVMCAITLLTVGRAESARQDIEARLNTADSRKLTVSDTRDKGFLNPDIIMAISQLSGVERVIGIGQTTDATNNAIPTTRVATWQLTGEISQAATLTSGRDPQPGEALISYQALQDLGMDAPVGAIRIIGNQQVYPVVGQFIAREPFGQLNTGIVIKAQQPSAIQSLQIVAADIDVFPSVQTAVIAVLDQPTTDIRVQAPPDMADLTSEIMGDFGDYGNSLLILVLISGSLLTAMVVGADVLINRADLGRRRALGAPRWVIVSLVAGRAALAASIGATLGDAITSAGLRLSGISIPWEFSLGTGILAILAAGLAAIPPGIAASTQDPVRVLRTP